MILDAGPLIAVDRGDSRVGDLVDLVARRGEVLRTSAPVVAQVWRDGARQARLARFLRATEVYPFEVADAARVGDLLQRSGRADAIDAHLVVLADQLGDDIVTADLADFAELVGTLGDRGPTVHRW